jgi:hypothetical protein
MFACNFLIWNLVFLAISVRSILLTDGIILNVFFQEATIRMEKFNYGCDPTILNCTINVVNIEDGFLINVTVDLFLPHPVVMVEYFNLMYKFSKPSKNIHKI